MKLPASGFRYLAVAAAELRRELYLTSVGCLDYRPGQPYPTAGHPEDYDFNWGAGRVLGDFAVVLIEKGSGMFESKLGRRSCHAGDVFAIPSGAWHRYRPNPRIGWRERWVCANGEYLHRLRAKRRLFEEAELLRPNNVPAIDASLEALFRNIMASDAPNDLATAAEALNIFGLLRGTNSRKDEDSRPESTGNELADAAREFIWFNNHRLLSVDVIARHLGVSRRTLE